MGDAGAVDGVAGGEVVAGIEHDVGLGDQRGRVRAPSMRCGMAVTRISGLMAASVRCADIALLVPREWVKWAIWRCRLVRSTVSPSQSVIVPTPAGGEVERGRGAQAAGADDQGMGAEQLFLALDADLRQQDVPAVAQELVVVHLHSA